ncbi:MAG: DNA polymerase III subunit beta [Candidatus Eisenbacteria bacterium]|nr:DNA polymerase III subunit beta [Candidatus Eisenbacteria bacterium]
MELTIEQGDLAFAVGRALGSVSTKSPLPLLCCVLLEADKSGLRVTGTDLDVTTSVLVPCTVSTPGRAAVSARHFNEVVRKMPRGTLTLSIVNRQCEVKYGAGVGWSRFPVQDAAEFPRIPELRAETKLSLPGDALARLIGRTAYAASNEETRPQLNGVLIQGNDKQVVFVSTDGHRLGKAVRKGAFGGLSKEGVIVPSRALQAVSRTAEEATSPVDIEIAAGKNQAGFSAQVGEYRVQILTRLLEGPYPNYEQVIPRGNPHTLSARRLDLLDAVDIVASHADNITRQVRFSVRKNQVGVSSATELGAGEHAVEAKYSGDDIEIGYNATYLLDILKCIPTEEVAFHLNTALAAGVVEPAGALPQADEELLCLIMPLRLPEASG